VALLSERDKCITSLSAAAAAAAAATESYSARFTPVRCGRLPLRTSGRPYVGGRRLDAAACFFAVSRYYKAHDNCHSGNSVRLSIVAKQRQTFSPSRID